MLVRGEGITASMSRYLVDRIAAQPNIELRTRTEIRALSGSPLAVIAALGASRTDLVDRNGRLLAADLLHYGLYVDPREIWDTAETRRGLCEPSCGGRRLGRPADPSFSGHMNRRGARHVFDRVSRYLVGCISWAVASRTAHAVPVRA